MTVFSLWPKQEAVEKIIKASPPRVLLLPPPGKGRSATVTQSEVYPEALAAREWMATKASAC